MSMLRRIGGPHAISAWSFVITMAVFVLVTLVPSERDRLVGDLGERTLLAVVGTAAGLVVLLLAWSTVLRPTGRGARPWTAVLVFAAAGTAQGVTVLALRQGMGLDALGGPWLVVGRAVGAVVWLSVIALVVDQARDHAARVAELQGRIRAMEHELARERDDLRGEVARMRDEVVAPVGHALDEIMRRLAAMPRSAYARDEAAALRALVDDEVRPLSHALLVDPPTAPAADSAAVVPPSRERLAEVVRLSVTTLAAPSWLAVLIPAVLIVLFSAGQVDTGFLAASGASYALVTWVLLDLARRRVEPRLAHMSTPAAALAVVGTYEVLATVAMVNGWAWGGVLGTDQWLEWTALVTLPVIWLALATIRAVARERRGVEARLREVLDGLAVVTTRRRQRIRHERQVLGRLLHGSVQATLLSVAARLARAADDRDPRQAVEVAAVELAELRDRLSAGPEEEWTVRGALDDLVVLWAGVLRVQVAANDVVLAAVDAAPATRSGVVDVVAEGLTNAVRHGGARHVTVRIAPEGEDRVEVEVVDDGSGMGPGEPGMGSAMLDEVAAWWSLDATPDGCRLRASVVLDGGVPGRAVPSGA